jgi:hypothetical protein
MPPPWASILRFFESNQGVRQSLSKQEATQGIPLDLLDNEDTCDSDDDDDDDDELEVANEVEVDDAVSSPRGCLEYLLLIGSQNDDLDDLDDEDDEDEDESSSVSDGAAVVEAAVVLPVRVELLTSNFTLAWFKSLFFTDSSGIPDIL